MDNFSALLGKKLAGSGGGSGTSNYNELENKPQINGQTLNGNKTSANLGLQSAINSDNKLSADLIDDSESTNKFVSANDILNWNNKYDSDDAYTKAQTDTAIETAIAALDVTETGGSGKYISAISEENGKIVATPTNFDTALSSSSTDGNAPTSKTVYDDQQRQEVEIGAVANRGAKNLLEVTSQTQTIDDVTFTVNSDQTITVNGTNNTQNAITYVIVSNDRAIEIPDGEYILSGCPQGGGASTYDLRWYLYSSVKSAYDNGSGATVNKNGNTTSSNIAIIIRAGVTVSNIVFKPMIRPAAITDSTFQPYALPNPTLTPAAIKAVDEGAKNFVRVLFTSKAATSTSPSVTNNTDGTITINGTRTGSNYVPVYDLESDITLSLSTRYTLPAGKYVATTINRTTATLQVYMHDGESLVSLAQAASNDVEFEYTETDKQTYPYICFRLNLSGSQSGITYNNVTICPMICTAADWAVSQKFVPYAPTNRELYEMIQALQSGTRSLSAPSESLSKGTIDITAEEEPEMLKSEVEKTEQEAEPEIEEKEGAEER